MPKNETEPRSGLPVVVFLQTNNQDLDQAIGMSMEAENITGLELKFFSGENEEVVAKLKGLEREPLVMVLDFGLTPDKVEKNFELVGQLKESFSQVQIKLWVYQNSLDSKRAEIEQKTNRSGEVNVGVVEKSADMTEMWRQIEKIRDANSRREVNG